MKIMIEMEGKNPRTGLQDMAYVTVEVDDMLVRRAADPKAYAMAEISSAVHEIFDTVGVK